MTGGWNGVGNQKGDTLFQSIDAENLTFLVLLLLLLLVLLLLLLLLFLFLLLLLLLVLILMVFMFLLVGEGLETGGGDERIPV